VSLRGRTCYLLHRLHIHNPDCGHCNTGQLCWSQLRTRLAELNGRTQLRPLEAQDHKEVVKVSKV
jgi:hypothetical protein